MHLVREIQALDTTWEKIFTFKNLNIYVLHYRMPSIVLGVTGETKMNKTK